MLAMLHSSATLHDHVYALDLSARVLLGPIAGLAAVVVVLLSARQRPALAAAVPAMAGLAALLWFFLSSSDSWVPTLHGLFPVADGLMAASVGAGISAFFAAATVVVVEKRLELRGVAAAVALVGLLGAALSEQTRSAWKARWNVPALLATPVEGHVGHSVDVVPTWGSQATKDCGWLGCTWKAEIGPASAPVDGCVAEHVPVRFERPGVVPHELSGRCEFSGVSLRVKRAVESRGFEEVGDARLPLRVGNVWRYQLVEHSVGGRVLWVFGGGTTSEKKSETFTLEVRATADQGGFRAFDVGAGAKRAWVVAAGGALFLLEDGVRKPFFVDDGSGVRAGIFGLVMAFDEGGPSRWYQSSESDVGAVVVAVLTLGLAVPPTKHSRWELVERIEGTGEGVVPSMPTAPPDAPEVVSARLELPVVTGALSLAVVTPALLKQRDGLDPCVDGPAAKVEVSFTVLPSGAVSGLSVTGGADSLRRCVDTWARGLRFPSAKGRTQVRETLTIQ